MFWMSLWCYKPIESCINFQFTIYEYIKKKKTVRTLRGECLWIVKSFISGSHIVATQVNDNNSSVIKMTTTVTTLTMTRKYATKTKCKISFTSYSKFSERERERSKALLCFTLRMLATPTCTLPSVCIFPAASLIAMFQRYLYYTYDRVYVTRLKHFLFRMRFTKRTHEEE